MNKHLFTEIIAFFSSENFFRLKSQEKQKEKFESLKESFNQEFNQELTEEIFNELLLYQLTQQKAKKEREREKMRKAAMLPISSGLNNATDHIKTLPHGRYVLTAAQNNTDIDSNFFESLLNYCKEKNAQLLVGKLTYNKNGFLQPDVQDSELWYDSAIKPYLVQGQICLGDNFHFIADANVLPTAKNPLSGFDGITKAGINAIIPASKIALKVSAALKNAPIKIITSTGSVTKRNYILRKAGTVAAIEHNIGAVFVDTETKELRHLEQMERFTGFYDIDKLYQPSEVISIESISCLQLGDIHAEKMENESLQKAINLIQKLNPEYLIVHDVLDFSSRNHHNIKDSTFIHMQHVNKNTVKGDLKSVAKVLDTLAECMNDGVIHVIESNHDLAINTWLKNSDFKDDPINAVTYLECMLALYKHTEKTGNTDFNMLKYAYTKIGKGKQSNWIQFHETDESLIISGVEHGCHGHNGVNGSRGSPMQFRALGIAMNTGHTHSPSIHGKVYTAGVTASLELGYNVGASSWAIAHIATYENGQRQIIFS